MNTSLRFFTKTQLHSNGTGLPVWHASLKISATASLRWKARAAITFQVCMHYGYTSVKSAASYFACMAILHFEQTDDPTRPRPRRSSTCQLSCAPVTNTEPGWSEANTDEQQRTRANTRNEKNCKSLHRETPTNVEQFRV